MLPLRPPSWRRPFRVLAVLAVLVLLLLPAAVSANVEKAIFLGPAAATSDFLPDSLSVALPRLHRLAPDDNTSSWRTHLSAAFPWAADFETKSATWVLLDGLRPGQRYEARVCWAATQPTAFALDAYAPDAVLASPALSKSLASFASFASLADAAHNDEPHVPLEPPTSFLLLRIIAAADYVAANRSLMLPERVPPVLVDLILDPFLLNVLPRSLAPTVAVVLVVAALSAALSRRIVRWLRSVAASGASRPHPRGTAAVRQAKTKQT